MSKKAPAAKKPRAQRGEYRSIYVALVDDPEFQELSAEARMIVFILKMKLGLSGIGIFMPETLPRYTGNSSERVSEGLSELIEKDWLRVERNVFWLRNGLRFDPTNPLGSKNHRAHVVHHIEALPRLKIVNDFADYYKLDRPFPDLAESAAEKGFEKGSESVPEVSRIPYTGNRIPYLTTTTPFPDGKGRPGRLPETDPPPDEPEEEVEFEIIPDDEPLPLVPIETGERPKVPVPKIQLEGLPFGNMDWSGRISGSHLLSEWMKLQPPGSVARGERSRFGAICKQIADEHTTGHIALAFFGMRYLWPYADPPLGKSHPWDPMDLQKNFTKAITAAQQAPALKAQREEQRILDAITSPRSSERPW